jgi:hypothetical protein
VAAAEWLAPSVKSLDVLRAKSAAEAWLAAKVLSMLSKSVSEAACAEATARNLFMIRLSDPACVDVARTL